MDTKQKPTGRRKAPPTRRRSQIGTVKPPVRQKASPQPRKTWTEAPEVTYVPPKPVSRTQFLLRIATVAAIVAAVTFGMSIFFKVKTVTVSGAVKYTPWQVMEASGISEGDSLMTFSKERAGGNIRAALPYVKSVRIGRILPDTVTIEIEEEEAVYSIKESGGGWWLMASSGKLLGSTDSGTAARNTIIQGVMIENPAEGQQAAAYQPVAGETAPTEEGEETTAPQPLTMTAARQLSAVLEILQHLESNGMLGSITSVDVSDMGRIELWYGTQYQINLGDQSQIGYKITCMAQAISQLESYQSGELDVSFTIWPNEVGYTPFG